MDKWEYNTIKLTRIGLAENLPQYGQTGWELIFGIPLAPTKEKLWEFYFKRKIDS